MASNNDSDQPTSPQPNRRIIQSMPDVRQQSYDEIYGVPENVLEIEVKDPEVVFKGKDPEYVLYTIVCKTNIPTFKLDRSIVKRRYTDFVHFRDILERESARVTIGALPGKVWGKKNFDDDVIEYRRVEFQNFLNKTAGHPLLQTGSRVLVSFIQDPNWDPQAW